MTTRARRMPRGVRLEQHGCVLSEILSEPGPTHSIFDLLSAAVEVFAPGPQVAMLGFAGGGMMAPLRKLGGTHVVEAVDLSAEGYALYRSVTGAWGGELKFEEDDAVAWLQGQRRKFDAIVEDLSVPRDGDVVKPEVSWMTLPRVMERSLKRDGVTISNLLPTPGVTWGGMIEACRIEGVGGVVVSLDDYYNRVLIQGRAIGEARVVGGQLRAVLRELGSDLAKGIAVCRLVAR